VRIFPVEIALQNIILQLFSFVGITIKVSYITNSREKSIQHGTKSDNANITTALNQKNVGFM